VCVCLVGILQEGEEVGGAGTTIILFPQRTTSFTNVFFF